MKYATCDSSTLILLAKTDLLNEIYYYIHKLLIPVDVFREVVIEGKKDNKLDALIVEKDIESKKIEVKEIKDDTFVKKLLKDFKFDEGEAEAIALTLQEDALFLGTDDGEAIKACRVYGIDFITALGLLVKLVEDQKILKDVALLKIDQLKKIGYYSSEIISNAIKECEKIWNK